MAFFNSGVGQYLAQVLCYAVLTLITLETLLAGWRVTTTSVHLRFRLVELALPVVAPLVFLAWAGLRTTPHFEQQVAFFDLATWLGQGLFWKVALWHVLVAGLGVTTVIFIIKEVVPAARHYLQRRSVCPGLPKGAAPALEAAVVEQSRALGIDPPVVCLAQETTPVAYVGTGRRLIVSEGVLELLDENELRALVGHELAHLSLRVRWTGRVLLALRWLQFFNPLVFPVYLRVHRDLEKWCDDISAGLTGRPLGLPSALLKINRALEENGQGQARAWAGAARLEYETNLGEVKERVRRRLRSEQSLPVSFPNLRLAVAALMLMAVLFFIV